MIVFSFHYGWCFTCLGHMVINATHSEVTSVQNACKPAELILFQAIWLKV
jgi:FPC/CPF motif-containing protein YcgG